MRLLLILEKRDYIDYDGYIYFFVTMVTKLTLDGNIILQPGSGWFQLYGVTWFPSLHKVDGDSIRGFYPLSEVYLLCCHGNIVGLKGDFIRDGVGQVTGSEVTGSGIAVGN